MRIVSHCLQRSCTAWRRNGSSQGWVIWRTHNIMSTVKCVSDQQTKNQERKKEDRGRKDSVSLRPNHCHGGEKCKISYKSIFRGPCWQQLKQAQTLCTYILYFFHHPVVVDHHVNLIKCQPQANFNQNIIQWVPINSAFGHSICSRVQHCTFPLQLILAMGCFLFQVM